MVTAIRRYTLAEFEAFIAQPDNADKTFEYIGGAIVEVPSNAFVSKLAGIILTFINMYLFQHDIGHATGEAGGYMVSGERYAPDVAFISYARQPQLARTGYNPNPPELAVEVISSDSAEELHRLRIKVSNYLAAHCIVWVIYPETRLIEVHEQGQPVQIYESGDTLNAPDILPGFSVSVDAIFSKI
jgi:Uma2 family endonuclease